MTTYSKKTSGFLFSGLLALFTMVMLFIIFPASANAATGTLGTETPYVYCTYEQDGVAVDGNKLTAGEYDVKVHLSGMQSCSVFQVSASYDESVVQVAKTASSLISDSNSELDSMGYILSNGNIIFGFVSTRDDCTPLEEDCVIADVSITFTQDCDAADYITVSADPNYTFAQADYGDGYSDEYAPDTQNYPDYSGALYSMECDVTPELNRNISGDIVVATSYTGATANKAAYGNYTIDVYDETGTTLVNTFTSTYDAENFTNTFSLELPEGIYKATVSYDYALVRDDITIIVGAENIEGALIPVIAANFNNNDTVVNVNDIRIVKSATNDSMGLEYCDLTADGTININDIRIAKACSAASPDMAPIIIEN